MAGGLALALALASCATAATLEGSEWRPTEIGGVNVPDGSEIFVRFEADGRLVGHGGCNRFFGAYNLEGNRIEIGALGTTRMACQEGVMKSEARFQQALGNARKFERDGIELSLTGEAEESLVLFRQTDAD